MKEQARQQRAQAATEWQAKPKAAPPPLFGPPIQVGANISDVLFNLTLMFSLNSHKIR